MSPINKVSIIIILIITLCLSGSRVPFLRGVGGVLRVCVTPQATTACDMTNLSICSDRATNDATISGQVAKCHAL